MTKARDLGSLLGASSQIDNTQTQIVITGTNFEITPNVELISTTGAITLADTVTRNSSTQLTINATLATDGDRKSVV